MKTLRPYQARAVEFCKPRPRAMVHAPAGSGKTIIASNVAAAVAEPFDRCIWLANTREQVQQAHDAIAATAQRVPVLYEVGCVAGKLDTAKADILILDECFTAETLVDGVRIDSVRVGDFVSAFNHKTGRIEKRKVVNVFKRNTRGALYQVRTKSGRVLTSTAGHPVFVIGLGYVTVGQMFGLRESISTAIQKAGGVSVQILQQQMQGSIHLREAEKTASVSVLSDLRETCNIPNPSQASRGGADECFLFQGVLHRIQEKSIFGDSDKDESAMEGVDLGQNETLKSNAKSRYAQKDEGIFSGENVFIQRRKWENDRSSIEAARNNRSYDGVSDPTRGRSEQLQIASEMLQGGPCAPRDETGDRGRWKLSQDEEVAFLGQEENGNTQFDWLDSIEILERGSNGRSGEMQEANTVYNLHVEGLNNYFANGILVHNCHHLPAESWVEKAISAAGKVFGFTATPWSGNWERDESLKAFFGAENIVKIERAEVKSFGAITEGVVFIHHLDKPGCFQFEIEAEAAALVAVRRQRWRFIPAHELMRRALWEITVNKTRTNPWRNQRIIELARQGDGVLVLVGSIEHGEYLAKGIGDAVLVHSKMGARKRREAIEAARAGHLRCMVSTSLADEGLDVPRLSTMINAVGGRSAAKLEQRAGRVMRPHESKDIGTVHDFSDAGSNLAFSQFKARCRVYKKLGYKISNYGAN